jgi:hypothetical protein
MSEQQSEEVVEEAQTEKEQEESDGAFGDKEAGPETETVSPEK